MSVASSMGLGDLHDLADVEDLLKAQPDPKAAVPPQTKKQQQEVMDDGRILFQMDLWCSDLLLTVLELDDKGDIVPTAAGANPLSPPGKEASIIDGSSRYL